MSDMCPVCSCSCPSLHGCCKPATFQTPCRCSSSWTSQGKARKLPLQTWLKTEIQASLGSRTRCSWRCQHLTLVAWCCAAVPCHVMAPCPLCRSLDLHHDGGSLCSCGCVFVHCCWVNALRGKDNVPSIAILTCSACLSHEPVVLMSSNGAVLDNVSCIIASGTDDWHNYSALLAGQSL